MHCGRGDGAVALTNVSMTIRADTLFSALCNEASLFYGDSAVNELIGQARAGAVLFTDTFPFRDDSYYLPVPKMPLDDKVEFDVKNRKAIKALKWLPATEEYFSRFAKYIHTGEAFDSTGLSQSFGEFRTDVKAGTIDDKKQPYEVTAFNFFRGCGLYGVFGYENDGQKALISELIKSIGVSGIGGQVSRGFGSYETEIRDGIDDSAAFLLENIGRKDRYNLLITTALPKNDEMENALEGAWYEVVRRGGFSWSAGTGSVKKNNQFFLASGAMLKNTFEGDVFEVGENERHKIYRYSKPVFLGVEI